MGISICDFEVSWKSKDGTIYRKDLHDIVKNYENQQEHDKEIRDKAIDTFLIAIEMLVKLHGAVTLSEIQEIAEKMKEVGE